MANDDTNSNQETASVDSIDDIANLLIEESVEDTEESTDQTEESTATTVDEETEEEEIETTDESEEEVEETEESEEESDTTWASALDMEDESIELDEEGNFKGVVIKVDGVTETVNMKDLISGYGNNKFNTIKSQSLSEEKKLFEGEKIKLTDEYNQRLESVSSLAEYLSKKITGDYEEVNWQRLRVEDPAEYAAMRQDFASKAQELQQLQGVLANEKTTQQEQISLKQQEIHQTYLNDEFAKVLVNNPTWSDKEVFSASMTELKSFLSDSYGFTDQDFAKVADSRLFELMKDAKSYRDGKLSAEKKVEKKPVPKFQKAKTRKAKKKVTRLDSLTKRAKSSTGQDRRSAEMDAVAELLTGGLK